MKLHWTTTIITLLLVAIFVSHAEANTVNIEIKGATNWNKCFMYSLNCQDISYDMHLVADYDPNPYPSYLDDYYRNQWFSFSSVTGTLNDDPIFGNMGDFSLVDRPVLSIPFQINGSDTGSFWWDDSKCGAIIVSVGGRNTILTSNLDPYFRGVMPVVFTYTVPEPGFLLLFGIGLVPCLLTKGRFKCKQSTD